ncbi:ArsB/NhaD family transporter [Sporomusa malonica]|uniref:Possible tyrosine transporter P-protein n=1 Tax=Sporomusa malonica TaxID=112901 RepID=A0A1W2EEI6_9FIRM|nr:ArsB/NhaD family transporter [Sporomusa malonica]SMD08153.1 possible tyrosine transporter P-protein [Sporomusa malonica]
MDNQVVIALAVFLVVYAVIISEKIHRTVIAMAGAMTVIGLGVLTQERAIQHIDFNTIGLLVGMMIIVNITAETGVFNYLAIWSAKKVNADPVKLFIALSTLTAVCSALLDNVTTVLLTVPVTISITSQLKVPPTPYLIAQILSSNIGGTATLIGDPPNIMIGSAVKELTFMAFVDNLTAVAFLIHFVTIAILVWIYRDKLKAPDELRAKIMQLDETKQLHNNKLLQTCLFVLTLTIGMFVAHQYLHLDSATVALIGASLLLLLTAGQSERNLEHIFNKIEWVALFFFIGLFVIVGGLVDTGIISFLAGKAIEFTSGNLVATSLLVLWFSAIASAFVDNIPFVATMIPLIKDLGSLGITNLEPIWWSLSLGSCLGGNGTIIGASANIIVAGMAAQQGYHITFRSYFKIAFPLMLLSICMSTVYVVIRYLM